jgi:hypothetical protein
VQLVGTLAGVVSGIKASKQNQDAIDNQKELDDAQLELMSDGQKKEFEIMERKIASELSPEQQIWSNPDLTQDEKVEAVAQVREALGTEPPAQEGAKKGMNMLYIGLGLLAVGGIVFAMTRGRK